VSKKTENNPILWLNPIEKGRFEAIFFRKKGRFEVFCPFFHIFAAVLMASFMPPTNKSEALCSSCYRKREKFLR